MTDRTFDALLGRTLTAYAEGGVREIDPMAIAESAAGTTRPRSPWLGGSAWSVGRSFSLAYLLLLIGLLLAIAVTVYIGARLLLQAAPAPYAEIFAPAGQLTMGRASPYVVQLPDRRVLISGGSGDETPAEIYDPATGTSIPVAGPAPSGTTGQAVLLKDGRVLVIAYNSNHTSSRAWIFDTQTEAFHELEQAGLASSPPFGIMPSVALLPDGRVLVAGGKRDAYEPEVLSSALTFDTASGTFSPTGSMSVPRIGHSMTALPDGRILVAGGFEAVPERLSLSRRGPGAPLSTAEIYDSLTGTFAPIGPMPTVRGPNLGLTLHDGRALILSVTLAQLSGPAASLNPAAIDVYDPAIGQFSALDGLSLAIDSAAVLRDGRILLAGTNQADQLGPDLPDGGYVIYTRYEPWAAIYDPADESVRQIQAPQTEYPGVASLMDGDVLFAGGTSHPTLGGDPVWLPSIELFQ